GDNPAALHELRDRFVIDRPQGIAGGGRVVARIEHPALVATRDEHQRPVELVHLVEKDRDVHGAGFWHPVVVLPGAEVLMPLPHVAIERHLPVDLELVHVNVLAEELNDRVDHARVARELGERQAVHVCGEVGAHGVTALLADILGTMLGVKARDFVAEHPDLFRPEQPWKEQEPVALEGVKLFPVDLHDENPSLLSILIIVGIRPRPLDAPSTYPIDYSLKFLQAPKSSARPEPGATP